MASPKRKTAPRKKEWPRAVSLFEVGPRDGLQSEKATLTVPQRLNLIEGLIQAGLKDIEIGSFVRADRIPQLANTNELVAAAQKKRAQLSSNAKFWSFVPNARGLEDAMKAGIDGVSLFVATSETFCKKNVNASQSDLMIELPALLHSARKNKLKARVYLSTLVFCPYEGVIAPEKVEKLVNRLIDAGAEEIALSDTTGHANPKSLAKVLEKVLKKHSPKNFALHLHDTRGLSLANIIEGMNFGLSRFDASVAGMGGCPYAPGASGNLATEDLVSMLDGLGIRTGVSLEKLGFAGHLAQKLVGRELPSRVLRTLKTPKEISA